MSARDLVAAALARLQGLQLVQGRTDKAFQLGAQEAREKLAQALREWPSLGAAEYDAARAEWLVTSAVEAVAAFERGQADGPEQMAAALRAISAWAAGLPGEDEPPQPGGFA